MKKMSERTLENCKTWWQFRQRFMSSFYLRWFQKRKKIVNDQCHFALLGSAHIKASTRKTLVKLTPVARKQWCCCERDKILSQKSWNKAHDTSKDRLWWKKVILDCNYDSKSNYSYSQTWVNDHLLLTTATIWRYHIRLLLHKWPLNNDHLSATVTILGSQQWSLYTGLTITSLNILANFGNPANKLVNYN